MPPIERPNYTTIPNSILGDIAKGNIFIAGIMAELQGAELKLLLAVCRITFGFHQKQRRASVEDIKTLTGLSRQGIYDAAARLEELNLITRLKDGGVTLWQVNVNSVDNDYCQPDVNLFDEHVNSVDTSCQLSRHPSKKETKKKHKNSTTISAADILTNIYLLTANGKPTQTGADIINSILDSYPADIIIYACQQAELNTTPSDDKRNLSYIEAVCKRKASGQPDKPYKNGANQNGYQTQKEGSQQNRQAQAGNSPAALEYPNQQGSSLGRVSQGLGDALKARARTGGGTT